MPSQGRVPLRVERVEQMTDLSPETRLTQHQRETMTRIANALVADAASVGDEVAFEHRAPAILLRYEAALSQAEQRIKDLEAELADDYDTRERMKVETRNRALEAENTRLRELLAERDETLAECNAERTALKRAAWRGKDVQPTGPYVLLADVYPELFTALTPAVPTPAPPHVDAPAGYQRDKGAMQRLFTRVPLTDAEQIDDIEPTPAPEDN